MTEFVTIAQVESIPDGEGRTFRVGDRLLAIFRRGDEFHAIDDLCPHMGASLGAGALDSDGVVICPWHAWRFNVCDGTWADNPRLKVETYEVRVVAGSVQVRVPNEQRDEP